MTDARRSAPPTDAACPAHSGGAPRPLAPGGAGRAAADALLREAGAVVPVLLPGEVPAVAVTRHEVLREVLAHPEVAKNACHFTALQDGTVDLRRHFAYPLPMSVISELLGVDAALRDRLHELSNLIVGTDGTADEVLAANHEITAVLGQRV
ncbi:hypothetical protein [Streptomyces sp. NPDC054765]